jgi:citrate lyase subunit beta/citryl-CoA lyase
VTGTAIVVQRGNNGILSRAFVSCKEFVLLLLNAAMHVFSYRSMLFVPAADGRKLAKAASSDADALILDWEDGTAALHKDNARRETLAYLSGARGNQPVWVRLNREGSPAFSDDRDALSSAVPDGIVLSKCESAASIVRVASLLNKRQSEHPCMLMPLIETASGLVAAAEIAGALPHIAAIGFGAEDFKAATGVLPGPEETELLYARSSIVVAARAAGVEPFESPCLEYRDLTAVERAAGRARKLGFSGAMAIHPAQIPAIHRAFMPTSAEIEHARAVASALDSQESGAVGYNGTMIDEAVVQRARRLLARAGIR